jgi:hypothetical protein
MVARRSNQLMVENCRWEVTAFKTYAYITFTYYNIAHKRIILYSQEEDYNITRDIQTVLKIMEAFTEEVCRK